MPLLSLPSSCHPRTSLAPGRPCSEPTAITQQIEHKLLKRGFQFNVIVVGACRRASAPCSLGPFPACRCSCPRQDCLADLRLLPFVCSVTAGQTGLGKSTLINTLFASHLVDSKGRLEAEEEARSTTEIHAHSHGASAQLDSGRRGDEG